MVQTVTLNVTLEVPAHMLGTIEDVFKERGWYIDSRIIPDTKSLYDSSSKFRRLVKDVKDAKIARDNFINENN